MVDHRPDVVKYKVILESLPRGKKKKKEKKLCSKISKVKLRGHRSWLKRLLLVKVRTICTSENNNNNRDRYNEF